MAGTFSMLFVRTIGNLPVSALGHILWWRPDATDCGWIPYFHTMTGSGIWHLQHNVRQSITKCCNSSPPPHYWHAPSAHMHAHNYMWCVCECIWERESVTSHWFLLHSSLTSVSNEWYQQLCWCVCHFCLCQYVCWCQHGLKKKNGYRLLFLVVVLQGCFCFIVVVFVFVFVFICCFGVLLLLFVLYMTFSVYTEKH